MPKRNYLTYTSKEEDKHLNTTFPSNKRGNFNVNEIIWSENRNIVLKIKFEYDLINFINLILFIDNIAFI